MTRAEDGFLSRWSKRKVAVRSGTETLAEAPARTGAVSETAAQDPRTLAPAPSTPVASAAAPTPAPVVEDPPRPTMEDVACLRRSSDFACFVQPGVDPAVSNAAMKKLFSDPRYNVMDGLDTYIGDYNTPDPIPLAMLRRMNQAKFLGLFDDGNEGEDRNEGKPETGSDTGTISVAAMTCTEASSVSAIRSASPEEACAPHRTQKYRSNDDADL
jgi:hypothetical protein